MNSECYRGIIVPASKSPDGECPEMVCVTQESNGWAVWHLGFYQSANKPVEWFSSRDVAIEYAVDFAAKHRGA